MHILIYKSKDYLTGRTPEDRVACFWPISDAKKPSKLLVNDSVYVAENGVINYYHLFWGFAVDPVLSDGSISGGLHLVLSPPMKIDYGNIKRQKIKKFPHFRYFEGL